MIRDMNGSVGLSREYGNVSHDTLPYFVVACLRPVGEQGGYWDLPGRVGKTYRGCCGKERPGSLVGKLAEVPVLRRITPGPVVQTRSGCADPVRSPAESRPYDVSIKFIRQGLLFLRKTFYLVTNFDAFGKEGAFFLSAEIIDLKASINYIITCKACPKLVSGLNH